MPYILKIESLDDEAEETIFETMDEAVKYAVDWFVAGYDNDTIDRDTRIAAAVDAVELARDLREGREFYCPRFYERASLRDAAGQLTQTEKP